MNIVHVFTDPSTLFSDSYKEMLIERKEKNNHIFFSLAEYSGWLFFTKKFKKEAVNADKIIIHGLFSVKLLVFLFLNRSILRKTIWTIWGGDLYSHNEKKIRLDLVISEFIKSHIVSKFGGIAVLVEADYNVAADYYRVTGSKFLVMYPKKDQDDAIQNIISMDSGKNINNTINILIGNSATESNNHLEVLNFLAEFANEDINIFVPLSYGDIDYSKKVVNAGKEIFGEKFIPVYEFMKMKDYMLFLNKMNVAFFNCDRQQALGNIYALLKMRVKIYIRDDTSIWAELHDKFSFELYSTKNIGTSFEEVVYMNEDDKIKNQKKALSLFSVDEAFDRWTKLFNS